MRTEGKLITHEIDLAAEEGEVDMWQVVARLWAGRLLIVVTTVLCTAIFAIVAFTMQPMYRASTVLVPAQHDNSALGGLGAALGQLGGLAAMAGVNVGGSGPQVEEAMAVLKSREFTERFITDKNLLPVLFPKRWDAQKQQWRDEKKRPSLADGSGYFMKKLRFVNLDKKTSLVTLSIEWHDPAVAAQWTNELVARLNSEMRARAIHSSDASMQYLQKELAATTALDTRQAINRLVENTINQRMFANVTEEYSFRIVDRALPPDRKDKVRPNKAILLGSGLVLGLLIGAATVLIRAAWRTRRESSAAI